jgi:hypothetical protein
MGCCETPSESESFGLVLRTFDCGYLGFTIYASFHGIVRFFLCYADLLAAQTIEDVLIAAYGS